MEVQIKSSVSRERDRHRLHNKAYVCVDIVYVREFEACVLKTNACFSKELMERK